MIGCRDGESEGAVTGVGPEPVLPVGIGGAGPGAGAALDEHLGAGEGGGVGIAVTQTGDCSHQLSEGLRGGDGHGERDDERPGRIVTVDHNVGVIVPGHLNLGRVEGQGYLLGIAGSQGPVPRRETEPGGDGWEAVEGLARVGEADGQFVLEGAGRIAAAVRGIGQADGAGLIFDAGGGVAPCLAAGILELEQNVSALEENHLPRPRGTWGILVESCVGKLDDGAETGAVRTGGETLVVSLSTDFEIDVAPQQGNEIGGLEDVG